MTKTAPALGAVFALLFGTAVSFGQEVSAEAGRHFEAGLAAVKAAASRADYSSAVREFEQAAALAPDWPGAFRALGFVHRAAAGYDEAQKCFRRYLELRPDADDAGRIRAAMDEMRSLRALDAGTSRILGEMASGKLVRKHIKREDVEGELGWTGTLEGYRMSSGKLEAENAWFSGPQYHPAEHPPIARRWEPVRVDGRSYGYAYSHYMDAAPGYVVRFDYVVSGEVVSIEPPRLEETVDWAVTWGAATKRDVPEWTAGDGHAGSQHFIIELVPAAMKDGKTSETRDEYGRTKLHLAAVQGRRDEAGSLIAAGADINARDGSGATPLHLAAGFGQRAVVDLLLLMNADREARNDAGDTPLHAAAYWGRTDTALLLIESGADVGARNKAGLTPLQTAEKQGHAETAEVLRGRGAK